MSEQAGPGHDDNSHDDNSDGGGGFDAGAAVPWLLDLRAGAEQAGAPGTARLALPGLVMGYARLGQLPDAARYAAQIPPLQAQPGRAHFADYPPPDDSEL